LKSIRSNRQIVNNDFHSTAGTGSEAVNHQTRLAGAAEIDCHTLVLDLADEAATTRARLAFTIALFNILVQWHGLQPDEIGFVHLSIAEFSL
jgi:hypothetical protein